MPPKTKSFGIETFPQSWSWLAVVVRWWKMKNWPHVHQYTLLWEQQKWNWVSNMKGKGPTAAESTQRWQRGWGKLGVTRIWVSPTSPIICCSFAIKFWFHQLHQPFVVHLPSNTFKQLSSRLSPHIIACTSSQRLWGLGLKRWFIAKTHHSKALKNCYIISLIPNFW